MFDNFTHYDIDIDYSDTGSYRMKAQDYTCFPGTSVCGALLKRRIHWYPENKWRL